MHQQFVNAERDQSGSVNGYGDCDADGDSFADIGKSVDLGSGRRHETDDISRHLQQEAGSVA